MTTGRINQVTISSSRGRTIYRATTSSRQMFVTDCNEIIVQKFFQLRLLDIIKDYAAPLDCDAQILDSKLTSFKSSRLGRSLTSRPI